MTRLYFVGSSTGRSAGFAPFDKFRVTRLAPTISRRLLGSRPAIPTDAVVLGANLPLRIPATEDSGDMMGYGVRGPRSRVTMSAGSARISSSVKRTSRQRLDA